MLLVLTRKERYVTLCNSMKTVPKNNKSPVKLAPPDVVLAAAQAAPHVFSISEYYPSLYLMREKGYSWRYISDWLKEFQIEISYVHLHRLYAKEHLRLTRLTRKELLALGMPPKMVAEHEEKKDPTKRLTAADPEDEPADDEEEDRR